MKNKKHLFKTLSLLLATVMLIPYMTGVVNAVTTNTDPQVQTETDVPASEDVYSSLTLDPEAVPDIIGEDSATEAGHVRRLYSEEDDLSTVIFQNADGTKTAYYYSYPVKYIDEDGKTKDIPLI